MSEKKEKQKKDVNGKLSTYVVVMLLSIIIVIIIAAMADGREQKFQSQIDITTQENMTIQNEIVALKDGNYQLEQENKALTAQLDELTKSDSVYKTLTEALNLYNEGKEEEAVSKFNEIDAASLPETTTAIYETVKSVINPDTFSAEND